MTCYFGTNIRWLPAYGPNQVTFPLVYDESMSIVQQIAYLMGAYQTLVDADGDKVPILTFEEFLRQLSADQAEQTAALQDYANAGDQRTLRQAEAYADKIGTAGVTWDVTRGRYADSQTTMRNLYQWLAVHAITVEQLAASVATCADLAAQTLNVRGLATWSAELVDGWEEPEGIRYVAPPDPPEPTTDPLTSEQLGASRVDRSGYIIVGTAPGSVAAGVEDVADAVVERKTNRVKRG